MYIDTSYISNTIDKVLLEFKLPNIDILPTEPIIAIDKADISRGIVALVLTRAGPLIKAKRATDIEDLYERKRTRLGHITLERLGNYWWVNKSEAYVRGKGYGTDLYVAAIKWASENDKGIVSAIPVPSNDKMRYRGLTKVSQSAMAVRNRIRERGVTLISGEFCKWIFDQDSAVINGVLMIGKGSVRFPVVDLGNYW